MGLDPKGVPKFWKGWEIGKCRFVNIFTFVSINHPGGRGVVWNKNNDRFIIFAKINF